MRSATFNFHTKSDTFSQVNFESTDSKLTRQGYRSSFFGLEKVNEIYKRRNIYVLVIFAELEKLHNCQILQ